MNRIMDALANAINARNLEEIRRLIAEEGADIHFSDGPGGSGPIIWAYGNVDVARVLIECGADINYTGFDEGTPLSVSAFCGDLDYLEFCLDVGADVNLRLPHSGETALHNAAVQRQTAAVKRLLRAGADPNLKAFAGKDSAMFSGGVKLWGETPLHFAAAYGDAEMIRAMLSAGADKRAENWRSEMPIVYAGRHQRDRAIFDLLR